jgi:pyruvate/2-oxoglutarate dehydrogenase complex dihydrolipoamide dehydrogenase (E3) component
MSTEYDSIIVGTGQAGPSLAARLAGSGQRVAIIERKLFGGTCVNTGCIPTKAMVASAYAAHMAKRAAEFGIQIEGAVTTDMKKVKSRKDAISGKSRDGVEHWLKHLENCTVYEGHGRFESPQAIGIGDLTITAPHIFINVGARAYVPSIPGLEETGYLTNSSMMDVDFLPSHLMILGGSYIAIEFGQMFRRFGSQVTIIQRGPRLVEREDEDISASVKEILEAEGISILLNTQCRSASRRGQDTVLQLQSPGTDTELTGSHLLVAIGRQPNTADLGLDKAKISIDKHGYIPVDDQLRTSTPGIWALGDCNGKGGFTHTSYNDYEIVAANLLDGDRNGEPRRVSDRITAYALYMDPPLGRAGMTEAEARKTGKPLLIAKRQMTKVGRAIEKGESQGFMKVVVDAETKLILGAAILGTGGDEAIHSILDVMYAKAPYTLIQRAMHIHPTVSELIPTMLGDLKPA